MLDHRTLYQSRSISLLDVRCSCGRGGWGAEESVETTRLVLPRRGVFERRARGRTTVAEPNRALWFHYGQTYRIRHPVDGGDRCTVVGAGRPLLAELAESAERRPGSWTDLVAATISPRLDAAHRELLRSAAEPGTDGFALEEASVHLLTTAIEATFEQATGEPIGAARDRRRLAERARLALASRLDRSLGLAELAEIVGCSPSHLCRAFRQATGHSLGAYRTRLRIRSALDRLAEGEDDLTGLALDLGFFDHAHFTRTFRNEIGVPPSCWRDEVWRGTPGRARSVPPDGSALRVRAASA